MISSIGVIKRRSTSKHKSKIKFEFGVEVMVEVVIIASPLVRELRRACDQSQRLRDSSFQPSFRPCLLPDFPSSLVLHLQLL